MDYLNWELERQREALAALLLGGGTEEELPREREGRPLRGEADSAVRGGARSRTVSGAVAGRREGPEVDSAWDGVLRARWAGERTGWWTGASEEPAGGGRVRFSDGGTGVRKTSGGDFPRRAIRRGLEETAGDGGALFAGTRLGGADRGGREDSGGASEVRRSGESLGGERAGGGDVSMASEGAAGRLWRDRGGGVPELSGLPVFQEITEGGGRFFGRAEGAFAAVRTGDGARALSRAVQRDARRYDGGFTIY
jgi:hypothetical protein